jgi:hypothetical protein
MYQQSDKEYKLYDIKVKKFLDSVASEIYVDDVENLVTDQYGVVMTEEEIEKENEEAYENKEMFDSIDIDGEIDYVVDIDMS